MSLKRVFRRSIIQEQRHLKIVVITLIKRVTSVNNDTKNLV